MARDMVRNASPRGWIVQKFGGTSVGKFPDKIAEDIIRYETHENIHDRILLTRVMYVRPWLGDHKLVVVCSARSTGKKVTGTTSR